MTMIASGMFPKPPQLFKGVGVTDDEAWETYWKVANGIRMTGMPGFKERLGETKVWQVSLLLKNADKLPPSVTGDLAPATVSTLPVPPAATAPANPTAPEQNQMH